MERMSVDNLSIGILARNSLSSSSRRASQISLLNETASDNYQHIDDRNWSWSFLRNSFRISDLGDLYRRYVRRLQNAYFNVYLLLQIFLSLSYVGALIFFSVVYEDDDHPRRLNESIDCQNHTNLIDKTPLDLAIPEIIAHGIIVAFCIIQMVYVWNEIVFRSNPYIQIVLSVLTATVLVVTDLGTSYYFKAVYECIRITSGFQSLIIVYFFLPLPRKIQAVMLGWVVTLAHLLFSSFAYDEPLYPRILSDIVYYSCANLVGTYSQLLSEVTIRRAFLDRRGYIKSTIKKAYEKDQEEQLLSSILPKHISIKVKEELLNAIKQIGDTPHHQNNHHHNPQPHHNNHRSHGTGPGNNHGVIHRKPFSDLFVEKHRNVTILYADIVNFTPLTVKLKADELVDTLNELFGRFDEAANSYNCLRIKLLGDCYYCVSGLPEPTPVHAKNCVQLGFEMIDIIKDVRDSLKVDVAMRIGIHSGNILSGLLGIYKWQFDIWSKDVTIANHMEQSGRPGRIHITKQTKEFLNGEYKCDPGDGKRRDKYLADNNVETFFIAVNKSPSSATIHENEAEGSDNGLSPTKTFLSSRAFQVPSNSLRRQSAIDLIRKKSLRVNPERRNYTSGADVQDFRKMMAKVNEQMEKAIDDMPLRKTDQWCRRRSQQSTTPTPNSHSQTQNVNPYFMNFESFSAEVQFQTQPDPLFKFYVGCSLFVLLCIGVIQAISVPPGHLVIWLSFGGGMSFLLALIPFSWVSYVWSRIKDPHRELDAIPEPENRLIKFFYGWSNSMSNSWTLRTTLYVIISLLISAFAIIDVSECDESEYDSEAKGEGENKCQNPWFFTYSCALAILVIYAFFRIHFLLKLFMSMLTLTFYGATVFQFRAYVFQHKQGVSPALSAVGAEMYSHIIYLVWITLLLHIMDRQMEYINRLDFIWKRKLTEEHTEASMTHAINKILIHNILPMQIAKIYLDPNRVREGHNRSYQNVSVMFASIPNFMDFYTETDLNDEGVKCLQILNEIIVEFDQVLFEHVDVEKIKVIGSTYMAACGLEVHDSSGRLSTISAPDPEYTPYRSLRERAQSNASEDIDVAEKSRQNTLMTLIEFSSKMMARLHSLNKDAFQDFQLRVGLATGPVVAGVIGVQKPLYDIWGDAVNLSSRMDSTGVPGKIQLSEDSAKLLMKMRVKCECRGVIKVKGKGDIKTYFVGLGPSPHFKILYDNVDNNVNILRLEDNISSTDL